MSRTFISICGASGAGKSQLAKCLVEHLGVETAARVPTDYYLLSDPEGRGVAYDWGLLSEALCQPDGTELTTPSFDFVHFRRIALTGGRPFTARPVMVLDAMLPYPGADFIFLLQAPDEERKRRIAARDSIWNTRVIDRWNQNEKALDSLTDSMYHYSMVLDGLLPVETNSLKMIEFLRKNGQKNCWPTQTSFE